MTRLVFLAVASLLAAGAVIPTASASTHCDYFEALCNAIAAVMRLCDQAVAGGCSVGIGPLPDLHWIEESVQHLCDHWIQKCDVSTGASPLLP